MISHFAKFGVRWLVDCAEARAVASKGRGTAPRAVRGRDMLEVLEKAKRCWESESVWRSRAVACIEDFSKREDCTHSDPAMLDTIPMLLDRSLWESRLGVELPIPGALDSIYEGHRTAALLAYRPLGVLLHICPGNSYFGGIESLLHGLLSGNQNIVKLSRNAPAVAAVVVELLETCGLSKGRAEVVLWASSEHRIEQELCRLVDGVVVWGSEFAVKHYRALVPPGVRFIEYGPKLSFSVMTAQFRHENSSLDALVEDCCKFEQLSCASPQFLLLEISDGECVDIVKEEFLLRMAGGFARYAERVPPPVKSKHVLTELLKTQELAKLAKARGRGDVVSGYPDWILIWVDDDQPVRPSSLFRTLLIYPYRDEVELAQRLAPVRHYLQTASVACGSNELQVIAELLWASGTQRVVEPGRSNVLMPGTPHDGGSILAAMCRMVSVESTVRRNSLWKGGGQNDTFQALRGLTQWARRAPFYARSFEKAGIGCELADWAAFHRLPWLTKDDLQAYGPPGSSELLTVPYDSTKGAYLFTTGGSTGEPKYALYSQDEWEVGAEIFCRTLEAVGITREDRVANLFNAGGLWSAFLVVNRGLEMLGCLNLPIGGATDPAELLRLLKSLGVTAVYGLPSVLLRLAHASECNTNLALQIPKIVYAGEHMSDAMRTYLGDVFCSQFVRSPLYASVDAGCIGYQCEHSPNGVFHALEQYAYVEFCSEETGRPVADGEEGEIIVTNFSRRLFPVLRIRTGDRGYRIIEPCVCGARNVLFRLLGRSDDMVRVGGANVHISDVDRLCANFSETLSLVYQLQFDRVGVDDRYVLCIETREHLGDEERQQLAIHVTEAYLQIAEEVREYLTGGILVHFRLSLLPPGTLKAIARTGKVRRVIDDR